VTSKEEFFGEKIKFGHFPTVNLIYYTVRTKVSKHLCPTFPGFCPDFRQIKTFGGGLAPPHPTPLTRHHCNIHYTAD